MIVIDCVDPTLALHLPPCAPAINAATLSQPRGPHLPLPVPQLTPERRLALTLPQDIRRGVWELSLQTDCGCFVTDVFIDICQRPALPGEHTPTADQTTHPECCVPDSYTRFQWCEGQPQPVIPQGHVIIDANGILHTLPLTRYGTYYHGVPA